MIGEEKQGAEGFRFHRIMLPTPYPVGRVNTYLLPERPAALVDVGVGSERSRRELENALSARRLAWEDIEAVLITHYHHDHAGAAPWIARRSGAPVYCHDDSIRDEHGARERFLELFSRFGAPATAATELREAWRQGDRFAQPLADAPEIVRLADGQRLEVGGTTLETIHTPGHSPGHLSFYVRDDEILLCGDLLLAQITANPLPHFDESSPRGRKTVLSLYLQSLTRIEALGRLRGLTGHGESIDDTAEAARRAARHIISRNDEVHHLMEEHPGQDLFWLAGRFFGEGHVVGQALAFCELLAHTDLLEDQGKLELDQQRGVPLLP